MKQQYITKSDREGENRKYLEDILGVDVHIVGRNENVIGSLIP